MNVPATVVCWLDQTLISPPLPWFTDDTSSVAPASTVTVLARSLATTLLREPSAFCVYVNSVVPTFIVPPLAAPLAEVVDPALTFTVLPCNVI